MKKDGIPYEIEVTKQGKYVIKVGEHFVRATRSYSGDFVSWKWEPLNGRSHDAITYGFRTRSGAKRRAKRLIKAYVKKREHEERAGSVVEEGEL